jgi:soluble cytochrome b562
MNKAAEDETHAVGTGVSVEGSTVTSRDAGEALRLRARWMIVAAVILLAGCGGSSQKASQAGAVEKAVGQREASEKRAKPAVENTKRLLECVAVDGAVTRMANAVSAASSGQEASEAVYEQASNAVESLRGKLAELASLTNPEQRTQIEESRRFLLKVGTLVEALKTRDLSLAQEELAGYRAGMVELTEHIKAACT